MKTTIYAYAWLTVLTALPVVLFWPEPSAAFSAAYIGLLFVACLCIVALTPYRPDNLLRVLAEHAEIALTVLWWGFRSGGRALVSILQGKPEVAAVRGEGLS